MAYATQAPGSAVGLGAGYGMAPAVGEPMIHRPMRAHSAPLPGAGMQWYHATEPIFAAAAAAPPIADARRADALREHRRLAAPLQRFEAALKVIEVALVLINILAACGVGCFGGSSGGLILGSINIGAIVVLRGGMAWAHYKACPQKSHLIEHGLYIVSILAVSILGIQGTLTCQMTGIATMILYLAILKGGYTLYAVQHARDTLEAN